MVAALGNLVGAGPGDTALGNGISAVAGFASAGMNISSIAKTQTDAGSSIVNNPAPAPDVLELPGGVDLSGVDSSVGQAGVNLQLSGGTTLNALTDPGGNYNLLIPKRSFDR